MSEFRRKLMIAYVANLGRNDIVYPGLIAAWSAKGKTNDDEDRAILKDLTGNGHDITLNGFVFSEMSGYGGYPLSFKDTKYKKWSSKYTDNTLSFVKDNQIWRFSVIIISNSIPSMKVNIKGIRNEDNIKYQYYDGTVSTYKTINLQNGEILLPESKIGNSEEVSSNSLAGFVGTVVGDNTVTITLLPEYHDALVFDGVDDYGINEDMPILTDYTIIAKRRSFTNKKGWTCTKNVPGGVVGEFLFENNTIPLTNVYSFIASSNKNYCNEDITWMNSTSYNGQSIIKGPSSGGKRFALGCLGRNIEEFFQGAIWCAYLFDRGLDEQEIKAFIRKYIDPEYLLPSEQESTNNSLVAKYECYDKTNEDEDRDILADLSGNGHDIQLYNFAWNEDSGFNKSTYNGALVSDGIDDYGLCENFPIFDNKKAFTICAIRKYITESESFSLLSDNPSSATSSGRIMFEKDGPVGESVISFGYNNNIDLEKNLFSFMTSNKYNNIAIQKGNYEFTNNIISLFRYSPNVDSLYCNVALYALEIYDRDLTDEEIAKVKADMIAEYEKKTGELYDTSIPDCYYDLSQGSNDDENRETIKDYSGNGNDAVAHNFAWNEEGSGYKDGALYFDGVNDYVSLDAFDSGFKTMFMVCKPFKTNKVIYDQRENTVLKDYGLYNLSVTIAYNSRNVNSTYINGVANNNLLCADLIDKKHLIYINSELKENNTPIIGCNFLHGDYMNMALYKFLGFKEALTEEQIQYVIKKYNLLDGVDEIEVS